MLRRCCICFFLLGALLPVIAAETCPGTGQVIGKLSREPVPYTGVSEQPDVPVSTGVIENPDAPADRQRYKMKYVKLSSGTLVPAIGVTVQF